MTLTLVKQPESTPSAPMTMDASAAERELVVFCPKCKTLETLWFTNGWLMSVRKFSQVNGELYHDCGSQEPCRLYRM
jgi:hypothetical protein